jgi:hypothetical protein
VVWRLRFVVDDDVPTRTLIEGGEHLLAALVTFNMPAIASRMVPPLYDSGVRYRRERGRAGADTWCTAREVFRRGWGDCEDLVAWRVAELQVGGERARGTLVIADTSEGILLHALVLRANGATEDPSARLGM